MNVGTALFVDSEADIERDVKKMDYRKILKCTGIFFEESTENGFEIFEKCLENPRKNGFEILVACFENTSKIYSEL